MLEKGHGKESRWFVAWPCIRLCLKLASHEKDIGGMLQDCAPGKVGRKAAGGCAFRIMLCGVRYMSVHSHDIYLDRGTESSASVAQSSTKASIHKMGM